MGVEAPGGDMDMLCGPSGVLTPGERDRGCAWRWCPDEAALAAVTAAVDIEDDGFVAGGVSVVVVVVGVEDEAAVFVVIDRGLEDVTVVVVVET